MVDHFGKESMRPDQWPRKVSVYCAKCPGEDGSEETVIYFKKYVKVSQVKSSEQGRERRKREVEGRMKDEALSESVGGIAFQKIAMNSKV